MTTQTVFKTAGSTSQTIDVFLAQKAAATSPGDPITGLAYNTSSFTAYYRKGATGTATAITLATQTVGGAYSSGGFVEISSTNAPGLYRFDIPDTVIATAGIASVTFNGAANQATHTVYIIVNAADMYDTVRLGLTALPNVASGSAGAIPTTGTGSNQINVSGGRADGNVTYWNGAVLTGKTGGFPEFGIVDSGTAQAATGTTLQLRSAAAFADSELIGATILIVSATTGAGQSRVITAYTGSTDTATVDTWTTTPTGTIVYVVFAGSPASTSLIPAVNATQFAGQTITAAAGVTLPSSVASPTNITAGTITTVTNLTNAPTAGDLTATMKTSVATAALTTAMTESYAADGATMTLAQACYLIAQTIGDFSVSGTTLTVKKLDGSTTAATYTLDSGSAPTSRTRAT